MSSKIANKDTVFLKKENKYGANLKNADNSKYFPENITTYVLLVVVGFQHGPKK